MMPYRIIILLYYMKGERMAKLGRPYKYHEDEVRPVTISLRIPPDLAEELKAYAAQHRQSITDVVMDGIRMRLDTPADPRDLILSDDNTVIPEVQEMIRAAVQAEVGRVSAFSQPHSHTPRGTPPEAAAEPAPALSSDDNTVLQENAVALKQCKNGHAPYPGSKSECPTCVRERKQRSRKAKRQPQPA